MMSMDIRIKAFIMYTFVVCSESATCASTISAASDAIVRALGTSTRLATALAAMLVLVMLSCGVVMSMFVR